MVSSKNDTFEAARKLKISGKLDKYIKNISTKFQPFIGPGKRFFCRKTGILAVFRGILLNFRPKKYSFRRVRKMKISGNLIHILKKLS